MHNFTFHQSGPRIKNLFLLLATVLFFGQKSISQKPAIVDKIDPAFRSLLLQKSLPETARKATTPFKVEPVEGYAYRGSAPEKRYQCFVYTKNGKALRDSGIVVNSVLPSFVTAWVTLEQIERLSSFGDVRYIEAPTADGLYNDISVATSGAALLHAGRLNNTIYKGKGAIVAVYDSGIDWDHPDFRNATDQTKSRILRMWDQTITAGTGEAPPIGFSYGVEYTQTQINDELDGSPANFVREKDINGHGTHVAGTAAGNGSALTSKKYTGMAPEADLIIIKGGNGSFPQSNTVDAITYLKGLANTLGRPIVLNMSIGGQDGPHDGSMAHEQAVDDFTGSGTGRVVVIAAGNDNGSAIHNQFTLAAGASTTISFTVPAGTTGTDVFQYSVFAAAGDTRALTAVATAPGGETVIAAGTSASGTVLTAGFRISIINSIYPTNGARYVNFYVARIGSNTTSPAGTWTLTITNNGSGTATMHGWLNYKNDVFATTALVGGDNNYLVGSPGNAATAITAASYAAKLTWWSGAAAGGYGYLSPTQQDNISTFSSIGPRRDGLQKPEISANGQAVVSCLSSDVTPAPTSSDVVEVGLYQKEQGTSMASPGVAGAVALLLQTNPGLTSTQVKSLITSTATSDALTGAVPNTTWGYGKLDVFKAAASVFNCSAVNRRTYQYDNSFTSTQNLGVLISSQRIAVRFTPDLTGKLAGFYFHTAATPLITDLVAEIRTNNSGNPATLLGTVNIPVANVVKFSWNYIDISSLSINITSGTDYFVVLYRDPSSGANWSLTRENTSLDNRSLLSSDGGTTWGTQAFDYRIRSVVYNNGQLAGTLATNNSADTRDINTSNQFLSNCNLIAQLVPTGANAVTGTVTSKVWIDGSVQTYNGDPYVTRHYEITPAANAGTATGRVTLYFTQAEFDAFNAVSGVDLPANPSDAAGKANLRVVKFPGTSSNGSGLPTTYSGSPSLINPADADIVWNAEQNRWEVSFDVTGFSGFTVQTNVAVLPVFIEYFTGRKQGAVNVLDWKAACTSGASVAFEILRSADGRTFEKVGTVNTSQFTCSQPATFTDPNPVAGNNFYRIRIVENGSAVRFTETVLLQSGKTPTTVAPTVLSKGAGIQVNFVGVKGNLSIKDATGKQVYTGTVIKGSQVLRPDLQASGVYFYFITDETGTATDTGKIMVK